MLKHILAAAALIMAVSAPLAGWAQDDSKPIKIALIASKSGPSEAYARTRSAACGSDWNTSRKA